MGTWYSINDHFITQSDKNKGYLIGLLIMTIIVTSISIIFIILEYVWFYEWWTNNIIIIVPVLFTIGYVLWVVFKTRQNGSLFTTSIILLYLVYLTWTALASRPSSSWNPFYHTGYGTVLQILLGLFFTFLVLIILASGTKGDKNTLETKFKNIAAEDREDNQQIEQQNKNGENIESHVFPISVATIIFHAFMIFVSIYYWMLISNWGRPTVKDDDYDYFIDKWAGFWVKLTCQWVVWILYLLSLLAPLIFRNREF